MFLGGYYQLLFRKKIRIRKYEITLVEFFFCRTKSEFYVGFNTTKIGIDKTPIF